MNALHSMSKIPATDRQLRWGATGLFVWLTVQVIGAGTQHLQSTGKAAAAIREYQRLRTQAAESHEGAVSDQVRRLQRNSLFVERRTRTQVPQTQAILGESVLIGDRWYRPGDTVNGFEIVSVGPDSVTLLNDSRERRLVPFDVEVNYGRSERDNRGHGDRTPRRGRR